MFIQHIHLFPSLMISSSHLIRYLITRGSLLSLETNCFGFNVLFFPNIFHYHKQFPSFHAFQLLFLEVSLLVFPLFIHQKEENTSTHGFPLTSDPAFEVFSQLLEFETFRES